MLLYTKEPYELIFKDDTPYNSVTRMVNGVMLEGNQQQDGLHVSRIISTDPKAYLRQDFSPGSIVRSPE